MKRYRIISELGKGATGVVFRAVRSEDGSTVALKKLVVPGHLDANEEEQFIRRFKSEAEAALSLDHPGVVKCLDCGLDEGTFYIAYELIDGVTLEDAMKAGRKFRADEVTDIIMQTSEALGYAHEQGVVHRDVSPGNVFLSDDGKVRIADFGVARISSRVTVTPGSEAIVGTPGYMAPEQVKGGGEADPRSDIFSLGCIVYELLTSEPAFGGENIAQTIHRVLNTQPKPIREFNPKIPLSLEELVFRMLAKNPDYRYQNMNEVRSAAEKVLETLPGDRKAEEFDDSGHAPILLCIAGPHEGAKFNLQPTVTTIGRTLGDILLNKDEKVGSQHAWITKEETGWVLYDADSEEGTYLNSEQIEREEILPGDKIRIGETVLEFRGAGGHAGAFIEPEGTMWKPEKTAKVESRAKRIPWIVVILALIPVIAVIAGSIYLGFILPGQYRTTLNDATDERWVSAFEKLEENRDPIGNWASEGPWVVDARGILSDWDENDIGDADDYRAPSWVMGHERLNAEAVYRFTLFKLAEDFLSAAVQSVDGDPQALAIQVNAVLALELRTDGLEPPSGVSAAWEGRKHQLLAMMRSWKSARGTVARTDGSGPRGFQSERDQARQYLLNGWYLFRDAGSDVILLEQAFNQFQLCRQELEPVLEANPGEADASAVSGTAAFLAARILRQTGNQNQTDRYRRALGILDESETYLSRVGQAAWDRSMPLSTYTDFRTPEEVLAQIGALRISLERLIGMGGGTE